MHKAAQAYQKVGQASLGGRELEAMVLLKAATKLQLIRENWEANSGQLEEALAYNRKLWTVLVSSATSKENPLPDAIKLNIAQLANFVFARTLDAQFEPAADKLGVLIAINRDVAAGLRGSSEPAALP